jgi:hypothetical protein
MPCTLQVVVPDAWPCADDVGWLPLPLQGHLCVPPLARMTCVWLNALHLAGCGA